MALKTKKNSIKKKIPLKKESVYLKDIKKSLLKSAIGLTIAGVSVLGYNKYQKYKSTQYRNKKQNESAGNIERNDLSIQKTNEEIIKQKNEENNRHIIYPKFAACEERAKPFGTKSDLDILPIELIDKILKNFTDMKDINKTCLQSQEYKNFCCINRARIFKESLKQLGYTKKITDENAEIIFTWMVPSYKLNKTKINNFFVRHSFNDDRTVSAFILSGPNVRTLSAYILSTVNDKITVSDIDNITWWFYPIIYYYTLNNTIKNYILNKYNKLTRDNIQRHPSKYFLYRNKKMIRYSVDIIQPKIGSLTDSDIKEYSNIIINYIKRINNPFIDY
jgi:hypothetical protein